MEVFVPALLAVHAAATCSMAGLVWFVQIVHYPLFAAVPAEGFRRYESLHTRRTTWVVGPLMLVELATALLLLVTPAGTAAPWLTGLGALLLAVIWGATFALQVPCHRALAAGFERRSHRRLVISNWVRTAAWSARAALALGLFAALG